MRYAPATAIGAILSQLLAAASAVADLPSEPLYLECEVRTRCQLESGNPCLPVSPKQNVLNKIDIQAKTWVQLWEYQDGDTGITNGVLAAADEDRITLVDKATEEGLRTLEVISRRTGSYYFFGQFSHPASSKMSIGTCRKTDRRLPAQLF